MSSRSPFDELERMFERMSRQFDRAASELGAELEPFVSDAVRVDLADDGEAFVLTADLPGFDTDDIDLHVDGRRVSLEASRTETSETALEDEAITADPDVDQPTYIRRERGQRTISRTLTLPEAVDEGSVEATYQNGVLTVTLPKRSGADEGQSIDID